MFDSTVYEGFYKSLYKVSVSSYSGKPNQKCLSDFKMFCELEWYSLSAISNFIEEMILAPHYFGLSYSMIEVLIGIIEMLESMSNSFSEFITPTDRYSLDVEKLNDIISKEMKIAVGLMCEKLNTDEDLSLSSIVWN